jgi:phosphatidylserine decarboxylase
MVAAVGVGHVTVRTIRRSRRTARVLPRGAPPSSYDEPKPIQRGEELGIFHLGSTTIAVFEAGRVELDALASGSSTKMGVGIGRVAQRPGTPEAEAGVQGT